MSTSKLTLGRLLFSGAIVGVAPRSSPGLVEVGLQSDPIDG